MNDYFKSKIRNGLIAFLSIIAAIYICGLVSGALAAGDERGSRIDSDYFVLKMEDVEVSEEIPFSVITKYDPSLPKGQIIVKQEGKNGLRKRAYTVLLLNGKEVFRAPISEIYMPQPSNTIQIIGTYVVPSYQLRPSRGEEGRQSRDESRAGRESQDESGAGSESSSPE